tara:strand:+ start:958 stop:1617 length:660 start_codon:yes stop_codon:yes gene_type:complete
MNREQLTITNMLLLLMFSPVLSAEENWQLKLERDGIQVYTRDVLDSKFDAVKTSTVIDDIRLNAIVALLNDIPAAEQWTVRCEDAYVYRRISATESITYNRSNLPLLYKDRWALWHSLWQQDNESLQATLKSKITNTNFDTPQNGVRISEGHVEWQLTPQESGGIRVTYSGHVEPGGSLPGWIANMLIKKAPLESMINFRDLVRSPKYRDANVDFIVEP